MNSSPLAPLLYLKPILTVLLMPPAGLLLLIALGLIMLVQKSKTIRGVAWSLLILASIGLWTLSCQSTAVWLSTHLLAQYPPLNLGNLSAQPAQRTLVDQSGKPVQAVVVLGGGTDPSVLEYGGEPQLALEAYSRLRYGVFISKKTGLPLVYSGGKGWGDLTDGQSEAQVARSTLQQDWNLDLKYADSESRDTRENAAMSFALLSGQGITRIVLVTNAWHMPRAQRNFLQAGFSVVPAPMGYITHSNSWLLDALPSGGGLRNSYWVLKEWLGLLIT